MEPNRIKRSKTGQLGWNFDAMGTSETSPKILKKKGMSVKEMNEFLKPRKVRRTRTKRPLSTSEKRKLFKSLENSPLRGSPRMKLAKQIQRDWRQTRPKFHRNLPSSVVRANRKTYKNITRGIRKPFLGLAALFGGLTAIDYFRSKSTLNKYQRKTKHKRRQ